MAAPGMGLGLQRAWGAALDKSSGCGLRRPGFESQLCKCGHSLPVSEPQCTGLEDGTHPSAHPDAARSCAERRARERRAGARSRGAGTHLRRTSGTGRGSATRCPGPRRTRCTRTRTAAGWPTAAALSPWSRSSRARLRLRRPLGFGVRPPGAPSRPGSAWGWPRASAARPLFNR